VTLDDAIDIQIFHFENENVGIWGWND